METEMKHFAPKILTTKKRERGQFEQSIIFKLAQELHQINGDMSRVSIRASFAAFSFYAGGCGAGDEVFW